jgi:hypothetical protein
MTNGNEDDKTKTWHREMVSWGHFVLTIVGMFVALASGWIVEKIALEHRLTVLEHATQVHSEMIRQEIEDVKSYRENAAKADAALSAKADGLSAQMNLLMIELAKHQAISDAYEDMEHPKNGRLKIPQLR